MIIQVGDSAPIGFQSGVGVIGNVQSAITRNIACSVN